MEQLQIAMKATGANTVRIAEPRIRLLPDIFRDEQDVPLHAQGYIRQEYLIDGFAEGEIYCTRLVLHSPEDPTKFSGLVVVEPSDSWGGTKVWLKIKRWIMRNGHGWLQVDSQAPSAIDITKEVDNKRYKDISFIATSTLEEIASSIPAALDAPEETVWNKYKVFKEMWWASTIQSPEILVAASHAARSGRLSVKANRVILCGMAQTGDVTRRFVLHESHLRLPDGSVSFEGYLPFQSDGGPALPDPRSSYVKVIETMGEYELFCHQNLYGNVNGLETYPHRRHDSDSYRLYEVPGLSNREAKYVPMADMAEMPYATFGSAPWSTFCSSFIYHAVFEAMDKWITKGAAPPPGAVISTGEGGDVIRDEHGNSVGGIRTVHSEAPTAQMVDINPRDRPNWYSGSESPFSEAKLRTLYESVANYQKLATDAIRCQLRAGFLLGADLKILYRDTVEKASF